MGQMYITNSGSAASVKTETEVRVQSRNAVPESLEKGKINLFQARYYSGPKCITNILLSFYQPKIRFFSNVLLLLLFLVGTSGYHS